MTRIPLRITPVADTDTNRVVIEWIMSSVCNYACHYCPIYLHDNRVRWPDYDSVHQFVATVAEHYRGNDITFLLSGGEITLWPHLPRMAADLRAHGIDVAILSNGTRPLTWWKTHAPTFDHVLLSYHHERAQPDHFRAVVDTIAATTSVDVNIVIDPAAFDTTMDLAATIQADGNAPVHRKIMFLDGWARPADYGPIQHTALTEALAGEVDQPGSREVALLKGDLDIEYIDGTHQVLTPSQIIDTGSNSWPGWTCNVGAESLFIRFDEIWPASCREGRRIGSIFDANLRLPTAGVTCAAESCNCIAGIKATKTAPTAAHH
ncbi:radical SAM protein (plasmid) [Nocardia sp. CWNU-33]|uniref:radical SAM protein n=1 Tax=Nocardia sp. CWNU-33 TaxID=3392117 RepID=UPI00398F7C32